MRSKQATTLACGALILAMLACNMPGQSSANQPDLAATITALALQVQNGTATPVATPLPGETAVPTNTAPPANTAPPINTAPPAATAVPPAPEKPTDFKTEGSATSITFSWTDKSINESGFRVYQDGVAAPVISVDAHTATGGMSYNWTSLACGFKGRFSVRAFNDVGESGSSKSAEGVTIPCQPGNLVIHNSSGNSLAFNWSVAASHNEAGFHIYQQGVSAPVASRGANLGSGGTNYDMIGMPCNVVATYYVRAFNSAGESPSSNLIQAETVPCGPSGLTITGTTKDTVKYTWTDNSTNETGFHIYIDDVLYVTLPAHAGTGPVSSDAFQLCGQNHVFSVKAFNYAGESVTSEHVGATTQGC